MAAELRAENSLPSPMTAGLFVFLSRHSGMVRRTRPGISRFRVRCFASPRNDGLIFPRSQDTDMASIYKDILIDAPAPDVWDAVRDFGALHTRLAPGFVLDTKLDGDARVVTFSNGPRARELLVDCDDDRRRLAYAVISERLTQHSASIQIIADGADRCRMIWITDVLPHEIAPYIGAQMDQGALAVQAAFRSKST